MLGLFDRRGRRGRTRAKEQRPGGKSPFEVVTHRGKSYLRPVGAVADAEGRRAAHSGGGHPMPIATGALLLTGIVVATAASMAAFSTAFEAATRALPEGSLSTLRSDASQALAIERDRRREALVALDGHIADAAANPTLQVTWRDLKRREIEAIRQMETHLEGIRPSLPLPGAAGLNP